jgi:hypothetical protein
VINEREVTQELRLLACAVIDKAARKLKIAEPELLFVRRSEFGEIYFDNPVYGFQLKRSVYLRNDLSPRQLIETAAHEVEHVRQYDKGQTPKGQERAATLFGLEFSCRVNGTTALELWRSLYHDATRLPSKPVPFDPRPPKRARYNELKNRRCY